MTTMLIYWAKSINVIKKNKEALFDASEVGIEVNVGKTKQACMFMSRHQNAGENRNINIANTSFENAARLKHLRTTVTNRKYIHEEIKSRLMSRAACYHSVHKKVSSRVLSKKGRILHSA
jgi:hypothetical protein